MVPSPKSHSHSVGPLDDVSVKLTRSSSTTELKDATGGSTTVTIKEVESEPPALEAVNVTVYVPGISNGRTGLWAVDRGPLSPKSQRHSVGSPVEESVNRSGWLTGTTAVGTVKLAIGGLGGSGRTVTVFAALSLPASFDTVWVTVNVPGSVQALTTFAP